MSDEREALRKALWHDLSELGQLRAANPEHGLGIQNVHQIIDVVFTTLDGMTTKVEPVERCVSGCDPETDPVMEHDSNGTPLCEGCWKDLLEWSNDDDAWVLRV